MALTAGGNAPYASPQTVAEVIARYRERGMTTPFTSEVLERAGVSPTLSNRTMQALRLLELIDADGQPTAEFEELTRVPEDEFKSLLRDLLRRVYAEVFAFADPAQDSYDRVRDAFRSFNPRGQQDRMVTLFLGLVEFAGGDVSGATRKRAESGPKKTSVPRTQKPAAKPSPATAKVVEASVAAVAPVEAAGLPPGLIGLLQQIPRGGAGWPSRRRDEFLAAFTAVLNFSVPTRDEEPGLSSEVP